MKRMAAIGEQLTLLYLELAGIKTVINVDSPEETLKHVNRLAKQDDYGLIFISSNLYTQISEEINSIQERDPIPIIIEIPEINKKVVMLNE